MFEPAEVRAGALRLQRAVGIVLHEAAGTGSVEPESLKWLAGVIGEVAWTDGKRRRFDAVAHALGGLDMATRGNLTEAMRRWETAERKLRKLCGQWAFGGPVLHMKAMFNTGETANQPSEGQAR